MKKLVRITTVPMSLKFLITDQMRYMKSHDWDVTMMSADGQEREEVIQREKCAHIIIPLTRKITPIADLKALIILIKELRVMKPNIVHTHTPKAGLIGMLASRVAGVPHRIHTVAGLPLHAAVGNKKRLLVWIEKLTYYCANQVWPNSNSLYEYIIDNKFTVKSKIKVIGKGSSNGIDIKEFDVDSLDETILESIKDKINYQEGLQYLLFVGRVVRDKGIEELVTVFEQIKNTYPNLRLVLVGPLESELDPLDSKITAIIEDNKEIITVGFSNHVKYYMHLADLFVFPSHREGFPNVPMQAALMNCPVVASAITGNVDIIDHNMNGLLHEKGNISDLKYCVEYALNNKEQMAILAGKLRTKILNNFDRRHMHQLILKEYESCISKTKN